MFISLFFCLFSFTALYSMEDKVTITIKTFNNKDDVSSVNQTLAVKLNSTVFDLINAYCNIYPFNLSPEKLGISAVFSRDFFISVENFTSLDGQKIVLMDGKHFVQTALTDFHSECLSTETTIQDIINTYKTLNFIIYEKKPN